jgi:hypothetical protein
MTVLCRFYVPIWIAELGLFQPTFFFLNKSIMAGTVPCLGSKVTRLQAASPSEENSDAALFLDTSFGIEYRESMEK